MEVEAEGYGKILTKMGQLEERVNTLYLSSCNINDKLELLVAENIRQETKQLACQNLWDERYVMRKTFTILFQNELEKLQIKGSRVRDKIKDFIWITNVAALLFIALSKFAH